MDDEGATPWDDRTIGRRLQAIRNSRRKSQRVVADLAGISRPYLAQLEAGTRALDRHSLVVRLANALEVAPSELIRLPITTPANGGTDSAVAAVRRAIVSVDLGRPGGQALDVDLLTDRFRDLQTRRRACEFPAVGAALPSLIRDVHTSISHGRQVSALLELAVALHVDLTHVWLRHAGAPEDLRWQAVTLARQAARHHEGASALGAATAASVYALLASGGYALAQAELDMLDLPATTDEAVGFVGSMLLAHSSVAAVDGRAQDAAAPLAEAVDLATRVGEVGQTDLYGFAFGPVDVGVRRMELAIEASEPDRAMSVASTVEPRGHPFASRQATYWVDCGRALVKLRGRREDAVQAFRTAEEIFPARVQRNVLVRETISAMMLSARRDAIGKELRGLAYRAGLPI